MAGNDADAHDALQEALIAIVRGLHRFDGRSAFTTWAYRVATNACLDELRRRKRRPVPGPARRRVARPPPVGGARRGRRVGRRPAAGSTRPWPTASTSTPRSRRLPEDFRAAVVLRDLCALDYAEIAEVLGIPPGTVRSRIARGRGLLAAPSGTAARPRERPSSGP